MNRCFLLLAALFVVSSAAARTWTESASGRKIEAEFVSADAQSVTIAVKGGGTFKIELGRLSAEDRAFVQERLKPAMKAAPAVAAKIEDSFEDLRVVAAKIPVSGEANASYAAVDEAVKAFMADKDVGAVTLAISKDGRILHDRAFGWADADLKTPLLPGVKMRLASMTKPVVHAAVETLFADKKLKPDDLVFQVLDLGQHKEAKGCDEHWQKVKIQHLLDHKGGWDREKSGDFTNDSPEMCDLFKVKLGELKPEHVMRYGLTRNFDWQPGEKYAYCNYGYVLLVRVIEKVSGQGFIDYLQATVCKEAKAPSFSLSSSDVRDRQAGEIWYSYHPEYPKKTVPLSFRTEARDGAGVLACTAADYCRFLEAYWISGKPRTKEGYRYSFSGSHPGVTAICAQLAGGLNYAAICNRRGTPGGESWNDDLRQRIDAALGKLAK
jgi:CubicO group peptidase (beta-lactamase class C family)